MRPGLAGPKLQAGQVQPFANNGFEVGYDCFQKSDWSCS
jgi:hypothetical protein